MANTIAELLQLVTDKVLTGGRRTTAVNLKDVYNPLINSTLNLKDGGLVVESQTGYTTEITPTDPKSFATKKYVDDLVGDLDLIDYQLISEKNQGNGYAGLDNTAKVELSYLPDFAFFLKYTDFASLPVLGFERNIYLTLDDNKLFYWDGASYVEMSIGGVTPTLQSVLTAGNTMMAGQLIQSEDTNSYLQIQDTGFYSQILSNFYLKMDSTTFESYFTNNKKLLFTTNNFEAKLTADLYTQLQPNNYKTQIALNNYFEQTSLGFETRFKSGNNETRLKLSSQNIALETFDLDNTTEIKASYFSAEMSVSRSANGDSLIKINHTTNELSNPNNQIYQFTGSTRINHGTDLTNTNTYTQILLNAAGLYFKRFVANVETESILLSSVPPSQTTTDEYFTSSVVTGVIGSTGATITFATELKQIPLVFVNGVKIKVGFDATPSNNLCFFSPNGISVREQLVEFVTGDLLYWNPLFVNSFDLAISDEINLVYNKI